MKKKRPNRRKATVFGIISFLFLACSKSDGNLPDSVNGSASSAGITNTNGGSAPLYAVRVTMQGSIFNPSEFMVTQGSTVLWYNNDAIVHTVTADNGSFDSGDLQPGASFTYKFSVIGPHSYHCKYHPEMIGLVKCVTK